MSLSLTFRLKRMRMRLILRLKRMRMRLVMSSELSIGGSFGIEPMLHGNHNLYINSKYDKPLESQAQGTSLFTRAVSSQRGCLRYQTEIQTMLPE